MSDEYPPAYFRVSSLDYKPDNFIKLGQVITDLRKPWSRITQPLVPLPDIEESYFNDWKDHRSRTRSGSLGLFAQILAPITGLGGDISGNVERVNELLMQFDRLDTFKIEPEQYYMDEVIAEPAIQHFLNANRFKSLYMITGIKVARAAQSTMSKERKFGHEASLAFDATQLGAPVQLGPKSSGERKNSHIQSFKMSSDFVYAFRVCRLFVRRSLRGNKYDRSNWEEFAKGATVHLPNDPTQEHERIELEARSFPPDIEDPGGEWLCDGFDEDVDFGAGIPPSGFDMIETEEEGHESCFLLQAPVGFDS